MSIKIALYSHPLYGNGIFETALKQPVLWVSSTAVRATARRSISVSCVSAGKGEVSLQSNKQIQCLVASQNPVKIQAAQNALQLAFPDIALIVEGRDVESGVADQPFGDEETLLGAQQRVANLAAALLEEHKQQGKEREGDGEHGVDPDDEHITPPHPPLVPFTVAATEAETRSGDDDRGSSPPPTSSQPPPTPPQLLLVGIEGGVSWDQEGNLECFTWIVLREGTSGKDFKARSASFMLPKKISDLVHDGLELGEANDKVFTRRKSGSGMGTIGDLSHGVITRIDDYTHTMSLALIPVVNSELYS